MSVRCLMLFEQGTYVCTCSGMCVDVYVCEREINMRELAMGIETIANKTHSLMLMSTHVCMSLHESDMIMLSLYRSSLPNCTLAQCTCAYYMLVGAL